MKAPMRCVIQNSKGRTWLTLMPALFFSISSRLLNKSVSKSDNEPAQANIVTWYPHHVNCKAIVYVTFKIQKKTRNPRSSTDSINDLPYGHCVACLQRSHVEAENGQIRARWIITESVNPWSWQKFADKCLEGRTSNLQTVSSDAESREVGNSSNLGAILFLLCERHNLSPCQLHLHRDPQSMIWWNLFSISQIQWLWCRSML